MEGKLNPEEFDKTFSLLTGVLDYQSFKDVDMVIEASLSLSTLKTSHTNLLCLLNILIFSHDRQFLRMFH